MLLTYNVSALEKRYRLHARTLLVSEELGFVSDRFGYSTQHSLDVVAELIILA
jgi:hypothetical protein